MQRVIALLGWLSFAVWLLSAPGCGGRIDGWVLGEGIPEEPFREALAEWSLAGHLGTIDPEGVHWIRLESPPPGKSWSGLAGWDAMHTRCRILIAPDMIDFRTRVLFLHELGHCYRGVGHLPPGNVMSVWLDDAAEHLTEADISESSD